MSQVFEDLSAYAARLGERTAGYTRTRKWSAIWGTDAWDAIPGNDRQVVAYKHIETLWDSSLDLLGEPDSTNIDQFGYEDLSLHMYSLYADMILEYLRTQGYERGLEQYIKALESRPKGYVRAEHGTNWGYEACDGILLDGKSECYRVASKMWDVASKMLGIPNLNFVDYPDSQEVSEQFYALFSDLIQEYIRNTRD